MSRELYVHALPSRVEPEEMAGKVVVVIDVLRASTTIIYALEAGAREVRPCVEVEEARELAAQMPEGDPVLGGERKGLLIEGFDLGNSPQEYTADRVKGRGVVFTTTNGTRAMDRCRLAARVLIGAFVNAEAVCQELAHWEQVHLLCAGTRGKPGNDDLLLAGLLVERIVRRGDTSYNLSPQAADARALWLDSFALPYALEAEPLEPERLAKQLSLTAGGRNLVAIGRDEDILVASELDRFWTVPKLDPHAMRIRLR